MFTDRIDAKARLAIAGLISFAAVPYAASAPLPETVDLSGVVRDFRRSHPDFNAVPVGGFGHYAGNIALTLGPQEQPDFAGGGFKVESQWRDSATRPMAPHLFKSGVDADVVQLADDPDIHQNATVDTWDSSDGPYGGSNVGPAPTFEVGAPMPVILEPGGLGPNVGDLSISNTTIADNVHCEDLTISGTVQISGNVIILCEDDFKLASHADLELLPGATLALYVKDGAAPVPSGAASAPP